MVKSEETFVHSEIEVKLTGRKATNENSKVTLVEITPASDNDGSWKKWVPLKSLFKIS